MKGEGAVVRQPRADERGWCVSRIGYVRKGNARAPRQKGPPVPVPHLPRHVSSSLTTTLPVVLHAHTQPTPQRPRRHRRRQRRQYTQWRPPRRPRHRPRPRSPTRYPLGPPHPTARPPAPPPTSKTSQSAKSAAGICWHARSSLR